MIFIVLDIHTMNLYTYSMKPSWNPPEASWIPQAGTTETSELDESDTSDSPATCSDQVGLNWARKKGLVWGIIVQNHLVFCLFPEMLVPLVIIHFSRIFLYKPSILGYPHWWKTPYSPNSYRMEKRENILNGKTMVFCRFSLKQIRGFIGHKLVLKYN